MGPIVCATRGGEAGRRTQERAVALAKERQTELIFLCVFGPCEAGTSNERLAAAVAEEKRWLGRALLGIAQARAQRAGIEAEAVVLCGPVLAKIESFLRQVGASALVIGEPRTDSALATFGPGKVQYFANQIVQEIGIEVVVVVPDSSGG